jgi:protein O-mannosyl-transferase
MTIQQTFAGRDLVDTGSIGLCWEGLFGQASPVTGNKLPAPSESHDRRWEPALICLFLAFLAFWALGPALESGFVNFDDDLYVYQNPVVRSGLSWKGLGWIFSHGDCGLYHPLTMLSLMVNYQINGLHPEGYHLANLLLHIGSAAALFLVLRRMTGLVWRSAFVAALFAVHPLRVESVAWVAERKDVLSGFFFMGTLAAYGVFIKRPDSLPRWLLVGIAYAMALLSKPTVVTLPVVLLLLDYWPLNRFGQPGAPRPGDGLGNPQRLILEKAPWLGLAAVICAMTLHAAANGIAARANASLVSRLGNAAVSYVIYLRQMVWPARLAVYYPQPAAGHSPATVALSMFILAAITVLAIGLRRQRPWLFTGWFWYLGMLAPMIGIIQPGSFAHADRMTYLPQIGIYLMVVWTIAEMGLASVGRRALLGATAAIALAALTVCARKQTSYWHDSETLWIRALACTGANPVAENNFGSALFHDGRVEEATLHFQKALEERPGYAEAHHNLAIVFLRKGQLDDAIAQDRLAVEIWPAFADAHFGLAAALFRKGKFNDAIAQYEMALQINPEDAEAHGNLAGALRQVGRLDDAIMQYREAIADDPSVGAFHNDLGTALRQKGRVGDAIDQFKRALELLPNNESVHVNLAYSLLQSGNAAAAVALFQAALQLHPDDVEVQNSLAWIRATSVQPSLRDGNQALQLAMRANLLTRERNPIVLGTLAAACAETGDFARAVENARKAIALAGAPGNQKLTRELSRQLDVYKSGQPFRQP